MIQDITISTEDLITIFVPPSERSGHLEWLEWQTWPFVDSQPKIGWSRGICEAADFFTSIKPGLEDAGQKAFWRGISSKTM